MLLLIIAVASGCSNKPESGKLDNWTKDYAAELIDKGLYEQAVESYKDLMLSPGITDKKKANISYMIAEIYKVKLSDYDNAVAHYLLVKHLDPESKLLDEINVDIVECLERSGRSSDAKRELSRTVSLADDSDKPGKPVAKVGSRYITDIELDRMISDASLDPGKLTPEQKSDFLRAKISQDLMANAGERKGYHKDNDILRRTEDFRRSLIARKVFVEEAGGKLDIDPEKVQLYYQAHINDFVDDDGNTKSFDDVKNEIFTKLSLEKQQEFASDYLYRLSQAEGVEFYEQNISGVQNKGAVD